MRSRFEKSLFLCLSVSLFANLEFKSSQADAALANCARLAFEKGAAAEVCFFERDALLRVRFIVQRRLVRECLTFWILMRKVGAFASISRERKILWRFRSQRTRACLVPAIRKKSPSPKRASQTETSLHVTESAFTYSQRGVSPLLSDAPLFRLWDTAERLSEFQESIKAQKAARTRAREASPSLPL